MFDISMAEMAIVGIVALIVVGPKDLPRMFRSVGQFVGKARGMARQFQSAMNEAARQSELQDIKSAVDGVKAAADPIGSARKSARDYANSMLGDLDPSASQTGASQTEKPEVPHFEDEGAPDWMPPRTEPVRAVPPAEARAAAAAAAAREAGAQPAAAPASAGPTAAQTDKET